MREIIIKLPTSRADLYFENYKPLVKLEQRAVAGETLIARKV